jgi:hypothetical protein
VSFNLWWAENDGMSGHVWLSVGDMLALREEMDAQGMTGEGALPTAKLAPREREVITAAELENALRRASDEPQILTDRKLWRDWLAFLDGGRSRGGIVVRSS